MNNRDIHPSNAIRRFLDLLSRRRQSEIPVKPTDFIRSFNVRYAYVTLLHLGVMNLYLLVTAADPGTAFIGHIVGAWLGVAAAQLIMLPKRLDSAISFARFIEQSHRDLFDELHLRHKVEGVKRGTVYVIQDADVTGWYKIGKTTKPSERIAHFDTMLPFEVRLVHIISSKNCDAVEAVLHRRFADKRQRGEWFALEGADIAWIKQMEDV